MYYLYILESLEYKRHYIGTASDLENRLNEHNSGEVRSTKAYRPWRRVYSESFVDKKTTRKRELFLKKNAKARKDLFATIMASSSSG